MEQTARYVLKGTLSYAARDGEVSEAQFIEMNAPTGRHSRQVASLRQAIVRAVIERERFDRTEALDAPVSAPPTPPADTPDEDEDDSEIASGIEVVNILARASGDLGDTYKVARELFVLKGVLKVDGDVQMTQTLLDNMTAQDFEHLVGAYIANFTLPS